MRSISLHFFTDGTTLFHSRPPFAFVSLLHSVKSVQRYLSLCLLNRPIRDAFDEFTVLRSRCKYHYHRRRSTCYSVACVSLGARRCALRARGLRNCNSRLLCHRRSGDVSTLWHQMKISFESLVRRFRVFIARSACGKAEHECSSDKEYC